MSPFFQYCQDSKTLYRILILSLYPICHVWRTIYLRCWVLDCDMNVGLTRVISEALIAVILSHIGFFDSTTHMGQPIWNWKCLSFITWTAQQSIHFLPSVNAAEHDDFVFLMSEPRLWRHCGICIFKSRDVRVTSLDNAPPTPSNLENVSLSFCS